MSEFYNCPMPQFPHLSDGENNYASFEPLSFAFQCVPCGPATPASAAGFSADILLNTLPTPTFSHSLLASSEQPPFQELLPLP